MTNKAEIQNTPENIDTKGQLWVKKHLHIQNVQSDLQPHLAGLAQ